MDASAQMLAGLERTLERQNEPPDSAALYRTEE